MGAPGPRARILPPTSGPVGAASAGVRHLRVTPIPRREPPRITADEAFEVAPLPSGDYVQGVLALSDPHDESFFERQPTARQHLPRPDAFARSLGQALVEVMWGARPSTQVVRWTTAEVYAVVARRSLVAVRRGLGGGRPPVVKRVRVCEPADGVAEAALVVIAGGRVRALALRLEGLDGRWVVTQILVG
ncbi:MAG: Rv3235 family protein [Actinomycetota bacterium]|nr:Rv3235 family protein [Actinomycetota bacterium]